MIAARSPYPRSCPQVLQVDGAIGGSLDDHDLEARHAVQRRRWPCADEGSADPPLIITTRLW
jgi:hypothetical protein